MYDYVYVNSWWLRTFPSRFELQCTCSTPGGPVNPTVSGWIVEGLGWCPWTGRKLESCRTGFPCLLWRSSTLKNPTVFFRWSWGNWSSDSGRDSYCCTLPSNLCLRIAQSLRKARCLSQVVSSLATYSSLCKALCGLALRSLPDAEFTRQDGPLHCIIHCICKPSTRRHTARYGSSLFSMLKLDLPICQFFCLV